MDGTLRSNPSSDVFFSLSDHRDLSCYDNVWQPSGQRLQWMTIGFVWAPGEGIETWMASWSWLLIDWTAMVTTKWWVGIKIPCKGRWDWILDRLMMVMWSIDVGSLRSVGIYQFAGMRAMSWCLARICSLVSMVLDLGLRAKDVDNDDKILNRNTNELTTLILIK